MTDRRRQPNIVFHMDQRTVTKDADGNTSFFIPFTMRKRNGRARIVPPEHPTEHRPAEGQGHVLRAVGRAWKWRRMLQKGEVSTLTEIADIEGISERYVSRMLKLAFLSPEVLEALVVQRRAPVLKLTDLAALADRPWPEQMAVAFR